MHVNSSCPWAELAGHPVEALQCLVPERSTFLSVATCSSRQGPFLVDVSLNTHCFIGRSTFPALLLWMIDLEYCSCQTFARTLCGSGICCGLTWNRLNSCMTFTGSPSRPGPEMTDMRHAVTRVPPSGGRAGEPPTDNQPEPRLDRHRHASLQPTVRQHNLLPLLPLQALSWLTPQCTGHGYLPGLAGRAWLPSDKGTPACCSPWCTPGIYHTLWYAHAVHGSRRSGAPRHKT